MFLRLGFSFFLGLGLCWIAQAQSPSLNELGSPLSTPDLLHHSLSIDLDPVRESIVVSDRMRLPQAWLGQNLHFELNSGLSITASNLPVSEEPNAQVASVDVIDSTVAQEAEVKRYLISVPASFIGELEINYSGTINDLAEQSSPEYSQSFAQSSGIISGEGVFLSRASVWVPLFDNALITFDLSAQFAPSASTWTTISQGQSAGLNGWRTQYPQEEIYLIAAEFTHYSESTGRVLASAYLRNPDPNLATKYLDATARYLKLYEPLLGDYPFSKFALVENFWETGFGMPSFTLLGPRVIRFPFILESSYPHELLHNWWGNGVYPDYETGNWSEGLTAYLADHLFREMDGSGHEYRKEMLARYKNYVSEGEDFPLSQFTSRNSAATQAVGYGKALMLWHMLRIELGDELFIDGLRQFYVTYQFQRASFADIENLFSELSGRDLSDFFAQWVNRTGAPQLEVAVEELNGNRARIMFAQTQFEEPYSLKVPVALFYEGESDPQIYFVSLTQKTEGVIAEEFDRLQSVLVDPFFDVFRSLDIEETPPTVGALFGADEIAFVLPSENKLEWSRLAESFAEGADFELIDAETLEQLPSNRSVWVLGNDNPFVPAVSSALDAFGVAWEPNEIRLADSEVPFENRSTVLVGRHPENPDLALGWIHIDELVAMSGLIEKLPHYGKYSYLSFTGEEPTNDVKGIWASADSPLRWVKPELDSSSIAWERLVPPPAIAELPPKYLPEQLARHTNVLTDAVMQGRGLGSDGLARAGHYIAEQFREAGLQPVGGTYIQPWRQEVPDLGQVTMANVMGMIPGSDAKLSSEPVVLGAHYDHLGTNEESGEFFPGADDNASGISVLIEVARKLARAFTPQRPILFVAFTGEESGLLGSDYFVNSSPDGFQLSSAFAMVNLDAVGRLEGRTLQIFGTESAYEWPFMAQGIGFTTGISSQFAAQTVASSDHVSFLNAGIPAIHLFSGTHLDYNQPTDTADKLDLAGMADVALWVEEAIVYLADRSDPLRVSLEQASQLSVSTSTTAREAVLGTVPDFAYQGQGIRISDVSPGGAAELAGLQARDVILQFNGQALGSLQTYSNMLRAAAPGDEIELTVRRGEQTLNFSAILQTR